MSWKQRTILTTSAGFVAVVLLIISAIYALQTGWFKENVRLRTVSAVEEATGGRVEIGSFDYDWRTLSAQFRNFVVHGTEPVSSQPLLRADSIHVGLKIISILRHDVDVASLVISHPRVHILVLPDGSTNVPSPQLGRRHAAETVRNLLSLKIRQLEVSDGVVEANSEELPMSIKAVNFALALTYDRRGPRYHVSTSSQKLEVNGAAFRGIPVRFEMQADLEQNRIVIRRAALASSNSSMQFSGPISDFVNPNADLQSSGNLAVAEVATVLRLPGFARGNLVLKGSLHYRHNQLITFNGKLNAQNVSYKSKLVSVLNANFQADVTGRPEELRLTHVTFAAAAGRFAGELNLDWSGLFRITGIVANLNLNQLARSADIREPTWSAQANGPIEIQGKLGNPARKVSARGRLDIFPGHSGVPVAGNVHFSYDGQTESLDFDPSHLSLPNTQLSFSGRWNSTLQAAFDSTNVHDLEASLPLLAPQFKATDIPVLLPNGSAHFDGTIAGPLANPRLSGNLALTHFQWQGQTWAAVRTHITASERAIEFSGLDVDQPALYAEGGGSIGLQNWTVQEDSPVQLHAQVRRVDLLKIAENFKFNLPRISGSGSGSFDLHGSFADPQGRAQMTIRDASVVGERINEVQIAATLARNQLQITQGQMRAGAAVLRFSAIYRYEQSWRRGDLELSIDSNGFPLASLAPVRRYQSGLNAEFEVHARGLLHIAPEQIVPKSADGTLVFRNLILNNVPYGNVIFKAATHDRTLTTTFSGDLRANHLAGEAQVELVNGSPAKGKLDFDRIDLSTLAALFDSGQNSLPLKGFVRGGIRFEGPLQQLDRMHGTLQLQDVQLSSVLPVRTTEDTNTSDFVLRSTSPVVLELTNGIALIRSFQLRGKQTAVALTGSIPCFSTKPLDVKVDGSMDMQVFQLFDPNVKASGQSVVAALIGGSISNPSVTGTLELTNGGFFLRDLPNGLTAVNGTVKFDRNRATIQTLTAKTGGGDLTLGGFVTFGSGPLVYRLEANAANIRLRYGPGISVTANSQLRLTGTSTNSILSGKATLSRVVFDPSADVGNLLAAIAARNAVPGDQQDFLTGLQFDVGITSTPNLQLSTALSRDVQAEIDLRVRGTAQQPVLLGRIVANQGDIRVFGTRYAINRGEINFVNTGRIEPVLDLDLRTEARGIAVDVTVSGPLSKLNINYRSDPPLQPRDIIALLTVGRAPGAAANVPNAQVTNEASTLQVGAGTVLGQAISPSSNRLSKLFGITNIKIDPLVQTTISTPQARLTLEQQISKQITVTYITNLSQTSEQVFRVEWALSTHYSIVALRDDNGEFGIDIQYRKRFK